MCRPVTCKTCQKITWSGCGQHVADVKASVPADMWCGGHTSSAAGGQGASKSGFFSRLFGRS